MSELTENSHLQSNITMPVIRGEIALISNYTDQQSGSSTYALFWVRDFCNIQCAVCVFTGVSKDFSWNLDLYFPGTFSIITDDHAKEIRCTVSFQFLSWICIQ